MGDVVVRAVGLGKRYRIGGVGANVKLKEVVTSLATAPLRAAARLASGRAAPPSGPGELWALRDVSFELGRGEVLGVIGRNGSGKSTLFKLLARITDPTTGRAEIRGRVAALLEVGTGFHPDLTGRENIFMAGILLGMNRAEIARNFDAIVEFAELAPFIDTPVKHYSSGMYLRLGFAVAAHLEPDVLIADEVLAVGDVSFQRKCLGRIGEAAEHGRTVLFVSHDMAAVQRLCSRALWLDGGVAKALGPTTDVVAQYLASGLSSLGGRTWEDDGGAPGDRLVRLKAVRIVDASGGQTGSIDIRDSFRIEIAYRVLEPVTGFRAWLQLYTAQHTCVFTAADVQDPAWLGRQREPGEYVSRCTIPGRLLQPGTHTIRLGAEVMPAGYGSTWDVEGAAYFEVLPTVLTGAQIHGGERWPGAISPDLPWEVVRLGP